MISLSILLILGIIYMDNSIHAPANQLGIRLVRIIIEHGSILQLHFRAFIEQDRHFGVGREYAAYAAFPQRSWLTWAA